MSETPRTEDQAKICETLCKEGYTGAVKAVLHMAGFSELLERELIAYANLHASADGSGHPIAKQIVKKLMTALSMAVKREHLANSKMMAAQLEMQKIQAERDALTALVNRLADVTENAEVEEVRGSNGYYCQLGDARASLMAAANMIRQALAEARKEGGADAARRIPKDFSSDGIHCDGECPHLKPYGEEMDLTAKCDLTGADLMWYDYWIAGECDQKDNK